MRDNQQRVRYDPRTEGRSVYYVWSVVFAHDGDTAVFDSREYALKVNTWGLEFTSRETMAEAVWAKGRAPARAVYAYPHSSVRAWSRTAYYYDEGV